MADRNGLCEEESKEQVRSVELDDDDDSDNDVDIDDEKTHIKLTIWKDRISQIQSNIYQWLPLRLVDGRCKAYFGKRSLLSSDGKTVGRGDILGMNFIVFLAVSGTWAIILLIVSFVAL